MSPPDNLPTATRHALRPATFLLSVVAAGILGTAGCATAESPAQAASPAAVAPSPRQAAPAPAAAIVAAVAARDRDAADRQLDAGRQPAALLDFAGIAPGQRVAEIQAGAGYTTELLARVVGASGKVWSQNNAFVLNRFAEAPLTARLAKPVNAQVVRVDRELEDPLPAEARDLDAVMLVLFYHDTVWQGADRARMNAAILRALKPGGSYVVVDHSARPGTGVADVKTLHRIDETVVRNEVLAAGFELSAESDFLRNPDDPRDWNASPGGAGARRGTSDRFVLRFVRP